MACDDVCDDLMSVSYLPGRLQVTFRWARATARSHLRLLAYHPPSRCLVAASQRPPPAANNGDGGGGNANAAAAGPGAGEGQWALELYHAGSLALVASLPLPVRFFPLSSSLCLHLAL